MAAHSELSSSGESFSLQSKIRQRSKTSALSDGDSSYLAGTAEPLPPRSARTGAAVFRLEEDGKEQGKVPWLHPTRTK